MSRRFRVDAVGLDWMIDKTFARDRIQSRLPVQGNLDPLALLAGGVALDRAVDAVLAAFGERPVHLQPRPRHPAGDADRARRADAQARARVNVVLALLRRYLRAEIAIAVTLAIFGVLMLSPPALYPWLKALHVIAVIAWMAGMLYLPRLFVYHCEAEPGSKQSETFKVMERRLLRAIINPAMVATWALGLWLVWDGGLACRRIGSRPRSSASWRCPRCMDFLRAGCAISPPTATGILRNSIG